MIIDLHMHSIMSDGMYTPKQLATFCCENNVEFAALTDHDTCIGSDEFIQEAKKLGIKTISGIEISANHGDKVVHILGYGIDYKNNGFKKRIDLLQALRVKRKEEILRLLAEKNIIITDEELSSCLGSSETVGRLHIAKAMCLKGYVGSILEAFDNYLGYGKSAYVSNYRLQPQEAINLITEYGGYAVLAHPKKIKMQNDELKNFIAELKEAGLSGIEAYYISHTKDDNSYFESMAKEFSLFTTCGSDFHDAAKGCVIGTVENYANVEKLLSKAN